MHLFKATSNQRNKKKGERKKKEENRGKTLEQAKNQTSHIHRSCPHSCKNHLFSINY